MKKYITLFFCALGFLEGLAQKSGVQLTFIPFYGNDHLVLNKFYHDGKDAVAIAKFKFYITNVTLLNNHAKVMTPANNDYLLDMEKSMQINIDMDKLPEFDGIKFTIGVDSVTNVSGAMGGDLDPIHGMYWTWQSGYINCKIEGIHANAASTGNRFQFHIGGYSYPNSTHKTVEFKTENKSDIEIILDVKSFLSGISWGDMHTIMSPGKSAVLMAEQFGKIFQIQK